MLNFNYKANKLIFICFFYYFCRYRITTIQRDEKKNHIILLDVIALCGVCGQ